MQSLEVPPRPLPRAWIWLLVPLAYFVGAKLGVAMAVMPEGVAIVWPPNSVLLAAMLMMRRRDIPLIGGLGVATEVVADLPTFTLVEALTFGTANALEASLACLLLTAWRFDPRLGTLADLRRFLLAGPLVAALVAAAIGAAVYSHFRGGQTSYLEFLRVWWMGDAMGLVIFTPLLLSWVTGGRGGQGAATSPRLVPADFAVGVVTAALVVVLLNSRGGLLGGVHLAPVLVIPCIVYLAARFDLRVVCAAVAVVSLAVAYATAHGGEPFGALPPGEASMRAQEFILTMSLLGLGLAALLAQLRARQDELRLANERLDQLNRELEARVAERTARLDDSNRQLQQLAMSDALTGLPNRRAFFAAARSALENARRHHHPLAAVMIDIDHFKYVNDVHGHAAGDSVLRQVAQVLTRTLRAGDFLARHGGEEFIVLAQETDLDSAMQLAHRMGDELRRQTLPVDGASVQVTASFGVTVLGGPDDDLDQLIRRADAAMYDAKNAGRDRASAVLPPSAA